MCSQKHLTLFPFFQFRLTFNSQEKRKSVVRDKKGRNYFCMVTRSHELRLKLLTAAAVSCYEPLLE